MLKVIDLFSGIGGFALGLQSTGYFKTIQFVENEKWCQKILAKNFPGVPIHDDVKTFQGYGADVVVGGFPCQPFSVAGKQKAVQDDRHLWPDMLRVIKETRPRWVIGENVRNIVSISDGMVLEQVYLDLESQGYEVQSFIIPASAVNAPHQRYRTWIVAHSECNKHRQEIRRSSEETSEVSREHRQNDNQSRQSSGASSIRFSDKGYDDVAHTKHTRSQNQSRRKFEELESQSREKEKRTRNKSTVCIKTSSTDVAHTERMGWKKRATQSEKFEGKATPNKFDYSSQRRSIGKAGEDVAHTNQERVFSTKIARNNGKDKQKSNDEHIGRCSTAFGRKVLQGNWSVEPNVGRVAHGIPNRVDRLKGLGNAIVPQIAYQIGKAIMEAEDGEFKMSSGM